MSDPGREAATRVIERSDRQTVLLVRQAVLRVMRGPDRGREIAIEGRAVKVGSDATCDLVLQDPAVSGAHLTIEPESRGFLLRDLRSTNGTLVDGYLVEGIYLPHTAQIELGQTRLRFSVSHQELELPLSRRTQFGGLLGHSEPMRQVFAILERVADTDSTVLIEGESGTGKEVAARALHHASSRARAPFVAVDCGALPANLVESELFGHSRGAFTGASSDRAGLLEEAEAGTVFLDEIGELPLDLQPKLLRVLETRTLRRLGEGRDRPLSARLVAATHRNLAHEVAGGRFREDLFFRLSVIRVRMPPLRERREEIPRLVAHFLSELGGDPAVHLPGAMLDLLAAYSWPGNVRELRNVVERLVRLPGMRPDFYLEGSPAAESSQTVGEMPLDLPFHEGKRVWIERFEREYLSHMLARCQGNISELARVTGLSRQSCHRLLHQHNLEPQG